MSRIVGCARNYGQSEAGRPRDCRMRAYGRTTDGPHGGGFPMRTVRGWRPVMRLARVSRPARGDTSMGKRGGRGIEAMGNLASLRGFRVAFSAVFLDAPRAALGFKGGRSWVDEYSNAKVEKDVACTSGAGTPGPWLSLHPEGPVRTFVESPDHDPANTHTYTGSLSSPNRSDRRGRRPAAPKERLVVVTRFGGHDQTRRIR